MRSEHFTSSALFAFNPKFRSVTELTEFGRSTRRNTYCVVILKFKFIRWMTVGPDGFLRHFSVRLYVQRDETEKS
jgi:hypothetical protein